MKKMSREFAACALWATALMLMIFGTSDSVRDNHTSAWLAWGLFAAIVACVPTGWALVKREFEEQESVTIEQITTTVDALHHARADVSPLH